MGLGWITDADLRQPNRTRKVGFILLEGTSIKRVHDFFISFNKCLLNAYYVPGFAVEIIHFLVVIRSKEANGKQVKEFVISH